MLNIFRKIRPQISATEQEAIDAGTVWWDGELFSGNPDWNKLLFPKPSLRDDEQAFLDNEVEQLCAMLDDWDITHKHADLPPEAWQLIRDKGFFGMIIPKRYGGLEFSAQAHSAVISKISLRSGTAQQPGRPIEPRALIQPGQRDDHFGYRAEDVGDAEVLDDRGLPPFQRQVRAGEPHRQGRPDSLDRCLRPKPPPGGAVGPEGRGRGVPSRRRPTCAPE